MADNPFAKKLPSANMYSWDMRANEGRNAAIDATYNPGGGTTTTPTTTGGSRGSSRGTTGSSAGYGSYLGSLYDQQRAAAQEAYNNGLNRLNSAYDSAAASYGNIYDRGAGVLKGQYNNSLDKINAAAQRSLQEAYVNRMMSEKNMGQRLAAQGITGGMAESTIAGLQNNYGNARNNLQRDWNTNRADLEQNYNSNLNDLYSAYQTQMANLEQQRAAAMNQLEANLLNNNAAYTENYMQMIKNDPTLLQAALSKATENQGAYVAPQEMVATNADAPVSIQQNNDMGQATQYARTTNGLLNGLDELQTNDDRIRFLANRGIPVNNIQKLLEQYYAYRA